jgi:pimeloyl-ACP methyl ester carboxylesterase
MEGRNIETESTPKPFEEQFANKQQIESLGGTVEVVDITPERQKTEIPIVFAPGWGETPETFKDSIRVMVDLQHRVLSLEHARNGEDIDTNEIERKYPADELRKAFALLDVLTKRGIERIDVIAHSEGAINTVIAAALQPEKFRNIVLVGPGGLIGEDKFPKLFGRYSVGVIRDIVSTISDPEIGRSVFRDNVERARYILKNIPLSISEGVGISNSDIHETLRELHDLGIGIVVIHGIDDPVFPMDRIQEVVNTDQLDGFYSVKGGHSEIWTHPEKYVALAEQALEDLAKNQEQEKIK